MIACSRHIQVRAQLLEIMEPPSRILVRCASASNSAASLVVMTIWIVALLTGPHPKPPTESGFSELSNPQYTLVPLHLVTPWE